jgi:predicted DNA-binding transcriptional regulator AlpA
MVAGRITATRGITVTTGPGDADLEGAVFAHPDRLLTAAEAAALLGMSAATFRAQARRSGLTPDEPQLDRPVNRRSPRWKLSTIAKWQHTRRGRATKRAEGDEAEPD